MDSIANFFNGLTNYDNLGFLGDLGQMWPLLFMVILFYFILYRPQKRQQKRRQEMFSNLKKNTKIVTVGGLYGVITDIKDGYVRIRIADKVEIKLKKESISAIAGDEED